MILLELQVMSDATGLYVSSVGGCESVTLKGMIIGAFYMSREHQIAPDNVTTDITADKRLF